MKIASRSAYALDTLPSLLTLLLAICLTANVSFAQAPAICDVRGVRTEILIDAPADSVWRVLTDVAAYPEWHPYLRSVEGKMQRGKMLHFTMAPTEKGERKFAAKLLAMRDPKEWAWGGAFLFFMKARHTFWLSDAGEGRTLLMQEELWGGLFGRSYGKKYFAEACKNFEKMNQALKIRVEQ